MTSARAVSGLLPRCFVLVLALAAGLTAGLAGPLGPRPADAAGAAATPADLERLAGWLSGSFSSEAQSRRDTSFRDVRLKIAPIWRNRGDGPWLYVEQAIAGAEARPYRQRIYRLAIGSDGRLESAIYALPAPLRFVGAWRDSTLLGRLSPDSLTARTGCSVYLRWDPSGKFTGGTEGNGCPSDLRGAAYATSEVDVRQDRMITLDRGYDASGTQVWGSEKGGYEFMRERLLKPRRSGGGQP
jgi:hypothetical protein